MTRRLLSLGGLGILAVVLNHAAGYGMIALFLWADTYLPVQSPYWEPLGSPAHYALLVTRSLGVFAVPAFLFMSGFFGAYVARGHDSGLQRWKAVLQRVIALAVPYLLWSIAIVILDALQGVVFTPLEYVSRLLSWGVAGHLFYVPMLCSCYLLSPGLVVLARNRPGRLVLVSAAIQAAAVAARYLEFWGVHSPILQWVIRVTPNWAFPRWITYFALGLVVAFNVGKTRRFLAKYQRQIVVLAGISWMLNIAEGSYLLQAYRTYWTAGVSTFSYHVFALSVIAGFLSLGDTAILKSGLVQDLGKRSYGIYLLHLPIIDLGARGVRKIAPGMLAHQAVLVPFLFVVGLGLPLLAMTALSRAKRARRAYRYLFG